MELSKDSIVSKHFSKKIIGGLSEFEVRDFLHVLAEEIRHLSQINCLQKKKIQEQEELVKDYRDREHILKESIQSAEKWAEKIRKEAETNSSLVLEKAQNKSEGLIQEARHSLQTVYNDILDLKRIQLQFKTGLKAALQVQMDLLEQDPVFSPALNTNDIEPLLEKKPPAKQENTASPHPGFSEEKTIDSENKVFSSKQDFSEKLKIKDTELSSLKESLKNLDKDFS